MTISAGSTVRSEPGDAFNTRYPFIRYDRTSFAGRQVAGFLDQHNLVPEQVLELDEIAAVVRMVQSGLGVSVVPRTSDGSADPDRLRILTLGPLAFHRTLQVVVRYAQRTNPAIALVLDCLKVTTAERGLSRTRGRGCPTASPSPCASPGSSAGRG